MAAAAVLGANDGIVSVGRHRHRVAGATTNRGAQPSSPLGWRAGRGGRVDGARRVRVRLQPRDSERAQIKQEKRELAASPQAELTELDRPVRSQGPFAATAHTVAVG